MPKRKTIEQFIVDAKKIHGDKYDYSLVKYVNTDVKVIIICPLHGEFKQTPHHHINGVKCPNCSHNKQKTTEEFIKKSKEIHGEEYDYSLVDYKSRYVKVKIICSIHGIFEQKPCDHLNGCGCQICKSSKGELKIIKFLNDKNIIYEVQKTFNDCNHKYKLKFDFYLPDYNICIEFDGEQHFKPFRFEKDNKRLQQTINNDIIKNEYCKNNNINLIRIKYNEDIDKKMNEIFNIY